MQPSLVVTREDLFSSSDDLESHVSVWLSWIFIVLKKLTEELERFSKELIEVLSVVVFQLSWFPVPQRFLFLV